MQRPGQPTCIEDAHLNPPPCPRTGGGPCAAAYWAQTGPLPCRAWAAGPAVSVLASGCAQGRAAACLHSSEETTWFRRTWWEEQRETATTRHPHVIYGVQEMSRRLSVPAVNDRPDPGHFALSRLVVPTYVSRLFTHWASNCIRCNSGACITQLVNRRPLQGLASLPSHWQSRLRCTPWIGCYTNGW